MFVQVEAVGTSLSDFAIVNLGFKALNPFDKVKFLLLKEVVLS